MGYEYEKRIIGMLGGVEDRHFIDLNDHKQELREVYAKAKAFDEIVKIEKETSLYSVAGKEDVELGTESRKVINKYMEDK